MLPITRESMPPNSRLESFRIHKLPQHFYYIPDFLTPSEEASLLLKIPSQRWTYLTHRRLQAHPSILTKTNTLLAAPLPNWLTTPIIDRFKDYDIFQETPHKAPNHVLVNEYQPGEGIMPHEDGAAYAPVVATVSLGGSLCLNILPKSSNSSTENQEQGTKYECDAAERFETEEETQSWFLPTRILQEPRSLLVTTGAGYGDYLHGIEEIEVDENLDSETVANWDLLGDCSSFVENGGRNVRGVRTSLTYRDVLRVSLAASRVLRGLGRR